MKFHAQAVPKISLWCNAKSHVLSLDATIMKLHIFLLLFSALPCVLAFELITGASFLIGATLSYYYGKETLKAGLNVLDLAVCSTGFRIYECCGKPWIEPSIGGKRVFKHRHEYYFKYLIRI